jgi:hypothetical protein
MYPLAIQVSTSSSGIVNIPRAIEVVSLRRPDVAAPRRRGSGIYHLLGGRLQAIESCSSRNSNVRPSCGEEVIVSPGIDNKGVASLWVSQGIGISSRLTQPDTAEQGEENGKKTNRNHLEELILRMKHFATLTRDSCFFYFSKGISE